MAQIIVRRADPVRRRGRNRAAGGSNAVPACTWRVATARWLPSAACGPPAPVGPGYGVKAAACTKADW